MTTDKYAATWPDDYDACLHLLDRQIVDVDGMMVGKVDDIELTEDDGELVPTGLLVGYGALLPRFGPRLGTWLKNRYAQMSVAHATRQAPSAVDIDMVVEVASGVHLDAPRAGLLMSRVETPEGPVHRRLGQLLGMAVHGHDALPKGCRVLDARLVTDPDRPGRHAVGALIIGKGRPGALLGYDRKEAGPWPVAAVVRHLHRHSKLLAWDDVAGVDWPERAVHVAPGASLRPLL